MGRFERLFTPITIGNVTVRNRILSTAHVTNFADHRRLATQQHVHYFAERARGGVGLIILESLAVHPSAGPTRFAMKIWDDENIQPLRAVTSAVLDLGGAIFAQINHGGREHNSMLTRRPLVSASATASPARREIPHAMTAPEIRELVDAFGTAAARVREAGFQGVEIHAGHGYLLQQFLSPYSNQREDEYGGSLKNRLRMLNDVLHLVRSRVGRDFVVGMRLSADEFTPGGIDLPQAQEIARRMAGTGLLDYLSVSQSNYSTAHTMMPDMSFERAPFIQLAAGIKQAVPQLPIVGVARILEPEQAETILRRGDADVVGMTRAQIADPFLARKAMEGREDEIRTCIGCNQGCVGRLVSHIDITCLQNPAVGFEGEWGGEEPPRAAVPRQVVVVGGGPGGMEAAWLAAAQGHLVTLLERSDRLGGQVNLITEVDSRTEFAGVTTYRQRMLTKYGVEIRLGVEATPELIEGLQPDAVIIATGSRPAIPPEWAGAGHVLTPWEILSGKAEAGPRVLIYDAEDNFQAMTVAEYLASRGHQIEIATRAAMVGQGIPTISLIPAYQRVHKAGVRFTTLTALQGWQDGKLVLANPFSEEKRLAEVDTLVLTGYRRANDELYHRLLGRVDQLHLVGDAAAPRQALEAIWEGHRAARALR